MDTQPQQLDDTDLVELPFVDIADLSGRKRQEQLLPGVVRRMERPRGSFSIRVDPDLSTADDIHKSYGQTTSMGICRFVQLLFIANETIPKHARMTDEQLARILVSEFPESKRVKNHPRSRLMSYYRSHYNSGSLIPKEGVPLLKSRRYTKSGEIANGYNGKALRGLKKLEADEEQAAQVAEWKRNGSVGVKVSKPRHRDHGQTGQPEEGFAEQEDWGMGGQ